MTLGKKIRGLRDELGMSQAQLSAQAELSQGYLSQLENDEVQNPSAAVIAQEGGNAGRYEVSVDPDLLSFLARIPREQQARLLKLFKGMERGTPAATRQSAG